MQYVNWYYEKVRKYTRGRLIAKTESLFDGLVLTRGKTLHTIHEHKGNHGIGLESIKTVL